MPLSAVFGFVYGSGGDSVYCGMDRIAGYPERAHWMNVEGRFNRSADLGSCQPDPHLYLTSITTSTTIPATLETRLPQGRYPCQTTGPSKVLTRGIVLPGAISRRSEITLFQVRASVSGWVPLNQVQQVFTDCRLMAIWMESRAKRTKFPPLRSTLPSGGKPLMMFGYSLGPLTRVKPFRPSNGRTTTINA